MFAGNMGMPAGTELVVPAAGALAAEGHLVPASWFVVGGVACAGEVLGAGALYAIGYYGGEPFVHRYGKYIGFREHELARVHAFFERYGKKTVFICRFIPFVRGVASLPAGISRMRKRFFFSYTIAGSLIFCFGLAALGFTAGSHIDRIMPYVHKFAYAVLAVAVVAAVAFIWRRRSARAASSLERP